MQNDQEQGGQVIQINQLEGPWVKMSCWAAIISLPIILPAQGFLHVN